MFFRCFFSNFLGRTFQWSSVDCVGYNDPLMTMPKAPFPKKMEEGSFLLDPPFLDRSIWRDPNPPWVGFLENWSSSSSWYGEFFFESTHMYMYIYIYTYMSMRIHLYIYIYVCLYLYQEPKKLTKLILWWWKNPVNNPLKKKGKFHQLSGYFTNFQGSGDEITRLAYPPWN